MDNPEKGRTLDKFKAEGQQRKSDSEMTKFRIV